MTEPWVAPPNTRRWTVGEDLEWCQLTLHDRDAVLWSRDELLDWYQDAYLQLLARAQSTRQWTIFDVPPRYTYTYTQPWELAFTQLGTAQHIGYRSRSGSTYTYAWEAEQASGLTPTDSAAVCVTQLWEFAHLPTGASTDQAYTFALPRFHERSARVYWDNKVLGARSTAELDHLGSTWWRESGEPWLWTRGTGGQRHFDIYQIRTDYQQGYDLLYNEATASGGPAGVPLGIVRELTGSRTYTAVSLDGSVPYGLARAVSSPDRQYMAQPSWEDPFGTIREWRSSVRSLALWDVVIPDYPRLSASETPGMIPGPLQKYLRVHVLWRAFSRQGEGQRLEMAALYEQIWLRGVALMKKLGWVTRRDRVLQRASRSLTRRAVPRPRLPSDFPRWIGA